MRDPKATTEPFGPEPTNRIGATRRGRFVVHCHAARRLHWDLRIEVGGVLQSFPVPRGPSFDPEQKRLAVQTEAHPLSYLHFEGVIPEGNYGAGAMIIWDYGRVTYPKQTVEEGLRDGALSLVFDGFKLKGRFSLVHTKRGNEDNQWLLIKRDDAYADPNLDIVEAAPRSVASGLTVEELPKRDELVATRVARLKDMKAPAEALKASRITPMLCSTTEVPLNDPKRDYELKLDGVRILAERRGDEARLFYRTHRAASASFQEIVRAVRALPGDNFIIDGEIVALDDKGMPSFAQLARRFHARKPAEQLFAERQTPVVYVVFDILAADGHDLRGFPLQQRREILHDLVRGQGFIRTLDHLAGDGGPLLAFCEANGLEGLVAKRRDTPYAEGPQRGDAWVKVKRAREDDFVVVGFKRGQGSRERLGSLELASYQDGALRHRGAVGSGLSESAIDVLLERLRPTDTAVCDVPGSAMPVAPDLVVRVRYGGWTEDGNVRFPVFIALREDADIQQATATPKADDATELLDQGADKAGRKVGRVTLTNQDKIFWPDDGLTKGDLCAYYEEIAPVLLPHLAQRPVSLVRFPDGIAGKSFFQWRILDTAPAWVTALELRSEEADGKDVHTVLIDSVDTLLYVANLGCIPMHVVASTTDDLDLCSYLTVDIDVKDATFQQGVEVALSLRALLDSIDLPGHPKTSGKSGLHVLIPLGAGLPFAPAKQLLELIGRLLLQRNPDIATMERRKANRGNKVFIDVGQTGRSRTIVAPYSVRAVAGARVSTPLQWSEMGRALDPGEFTIHTVGERVRELGDPMSGMYARPVNIPSVMSALEALFKG